MKKLDVWILSLFLISVGGIFCLFFYIVGSIDGGRRISQEAISHGLAHWEIKSQSDPQIIFRWNDQQAGFVTRKDTP